MTPKRGTESIFMLLKQRIQVGQRWKKVWGRDKSEQAFRGSITMKEFEGHPKSEVLKLERKLKSPGRFVQPGHWTPPPEFLI